MRWAFDLDGTLVDTNLAVRHAYQLCGVKMPSFAWGRTWREWLPGLSGQYLVVGDPDRRLTLEEAKIIHERKCDIYPECLIRYAEPLPLFFRVNEMPKNALTILTGASNEAVRALKRTSLRIDFVVYAGLTRAQKVEWLSRHGWGTYVDDDPETRELVKEHTTWKVLTPEEALELLSSPLARTRGSRAAFQRS